MGDVGAGRDTAGAVRELERRVRRLDRLIRHWSVTRWSGTASDGRTRQEVAHELATALAHLARRAGNGAPDVAPQRLLPHAIADQLALLGQELIDAPEAAGYAEAGAAAVDRAMDLLARAGG